MDFIRKNKEKLILLPFYMGLSIELLILLIDKSVLINPIEGQLFRITFLLFAMKMCFTKYSLKEWIWIGIFVILGIVSYQYTGRNEILRIVVFIAAMKHMDMKKILHYVFIVTLAGCLFIALLSIAGIMGEVSVVQEYRKGIYENRYCFGMGHPNAVHCMFFMLLLLFMYLYQEKLKLPIYILLFMGNLILYFFTDSRTGLGITTLAIVMACLLHKGVKIQKSVRIYWIGIAILIVCILLSVWAAKISEQVWFSPILMKIDGLFSGRILNLYYGSTNHEGIFKTWSLLSSPSNTYYFDMGWVRLFYWYGIIPGIVYVILNLLLLIQCLKKRDYMGLTMIVMIAIYSIVEAHVISVYIARNYILFLLGANMSEILHASGSREVYWWNGYRLLWKGHSSDAG